MKHASFFTLALCCGLLPGCSGDSTPATLPVQRAPAASTQSADVGNGAQAKYALMQQLRRFRSDQRVYENPQVVAAQEAARQAQLKWVQARDAHPALQSMVEKANGLMSQAPREAQGGDPDLAKRLAGEAGVAKAELEQAGLRLTDLAPLNEARQSAQRDVERAEIEALKTLSQARDLAEQWEVLLDADAPRPPEGGS